MSREFGEYGGGGYFHDKMRAALEDLQDCAREDFHKKFIPLFEELYDLAYAISSVEACDSGIDRSIFQALESLPKMKKTLNEIQEDLTAYRRVAEAAVRKAVDEQTKAS